MLWKCEQFAGDLLFVRQRRCTFSQAGCAQSAQEEPAPVAAAPQHTHAPISASNGSFQLPGPKIRSAPKEGARSSLNGGRLAAQSFSVGEPPANERRGAGGIGRAESSTDFLQGLAVQLAAS